MNDTLTTQPVLSILSAAPRVFSGAAVSGQQEMSIPLAETIAELRFQENVYQSVMETSRRTLAVLSRFELTY